MIILATKPNGCYKNTSCTHLRCQNKNRDKLHKRWRHVESTNRNPSSTYLCTHLLSFLVQHSCKMLQVSFPKAGCMQKSLLVQHSRSSTGPAQQTGNAHMFRPIPVQKVVFIMPPSVFQSSCVYDRFCFQFKSWPNGETKVMAMLTSAVYKAWDHCLWKSWQLQSTICWVLPVTGEQSQVVLLLE